MPRRLAAALTVSAIALLTLGGPASAHVSVNPREATKGGFAKLSFRVPTESADASTVKLEVQFPDPTTAPLAFASVQPHPGWSYKVDTVHLDTPVKSDDGDVTDVVGTITWTADSPDAGIKPGEFDEFNISVGPLPTTVDSMTFKAVQTYSNGDVVRWIEAGESADHPAPVLTLTAATDATAASTVDSSDVDGAKTLGVIGIVVGALGLLVAVGALVSARKRTT
jgi:uncharacterized protein